MSEKDQKKDEADKEEIMKTIKEIIEKNNHVLRRLRKKKD